MLLLLSPLSAAPQQVDTAAAAEQQGQPEENTPAPADGEKTESAGTAGTEDAAPAEEPEEAKEPPRFREPTYAMEERRHQPVEITIHPSWKLTPAQMETVSRLPVPRQNGKGYLYPEDLEPTAEQKADGSALSANQRSLMRKARKTACNKACWQSFRDAQAYNKEHEEELVANMKKGKHIRINLSTQHGYFMDGDTLLLDFSVCTGKKSTPTPTGLFCITQKDKNHRSNKYNNASMPFFMRLTGDGVGLHQGPLMGYPASHGCIRLSYSTAKHLYANCEMNTLVYLYKDPKEAVPKKPAPAKKATTRQRKR